MTSLDRTFDSMIGALREHVLPQLDDDFARGQAYGVIYMLEQVRLQADWSVPELLSQLAHQRQAASTLAGLCEGIDLPGPPPEATVIPAAGLAGSQLVMLRDAGDDWLSRVFEWLAVQRQNLPAERAAAIEDAARVCAREVNAIESRQTPRPMFAQIASGRET